MEANEVEYAGDTGIPVQLDGTLLVGDVAVWVESLCPVPVEQEPNQSETLEQTLARLQSNSHASLAFEYCMNGVAQPVWESTVSSYPVVSPEEAAMSEVEVIAWVRESIGA